MLSLKNTPFKFKHTPSHHEVLELIKSKIKGHIRTDEIALDFYSTDGSIFSVRPLAVFYPKDIYDIQLTLKILNSSADAGTVIPLIPRGRGTDQAGGPLGEGIIIEFSESLNQILEIGESFVRVQPGARYGELQKLLKERGKYLPPYPASFELSTIGGALANNSAGEKSLKYGTTRNFVLSMKVILANGDIIETHPMEHREVDHKSRQKSFEGKIYHDLTLILRENRDIVDANRPHVSKNAAGYDLWHLARHGQLDIGQLILGSQGTLGIIVEATLKVVDLPKKFGLLSGYFKDIGSASQAVMDLMHLKPSALELADKYLIELVNKKDPSKLAGLLPKKLPTIIILCEFDNENQHVLNQKLKLAEKVMKKYAYEVKLTTDEDEQERLWKVRRSAAAIMWTTGGRKKALPIIEDGVVHVSLLAQFLSQVYALLKKYQLTIAVWGHAGDANLHMQPFINLGDKSDREKVYKVMDEFYKMVKDLDGTTCGEHNDGILRTPYLPLIYGDEMYQVFVKVKELFDPLGILNSGKKVGMTKAKAKSLLRHNYSLENLVSKRELLNR